MTINDVKGDDILQDSSQEPSTYYKNELWWWMVLDTLIIVLESWNLVHKSRITYYDDPWCQGWPHRPSLQSGTFSLLQVWLWGRGGSWGTSNNARDMKFCTQVTNCVSWQSWISRGCWEGRMANMGGPKANRSGPKAHRSGPKAHQAPPEGLEFEGRVPHSNSSVEKLR